MREVSYKDFAKDFYGKLIGRKPLHGQIELTHRCAFRCPYCYLKNQLSNNSNNKELSFKDWARILDELYREGCMCLTFTGGDPILREDFADIYLYAKRKAFIITVFTNATSLTEDALNLFKRYPPFSIEVTLNSLREDRFDYLTGIKGIFKVCFTNIRKAIESGLPIILKTNGLKTNKDEIIQIKELAKALLGEKRYKFDTYITPALDGDKKPIEFRLSVNDIIELEESDEEIKEAIKESYKADPQVLADNGNLYKCNTWLTSFFIDPYGILKFCHLTDKYSTDLKRYPFKTGFYEVFPKLTEEKYRTNSRCKSCEFSPECMTCPARSLLEAGDEERCVDYFCELARARTEQKMRLTL